MMRLGQPAHAPGAPDAGAVPRPNLKEIPFDYVARFKLTGIRGNRVQDVINVSVEGNFVAVSIGYSFVAASPRIQAVGELNDALLTRTRGAALTVEMLGALLLSTVCRPIDFFYSFVDSGTGRELQNEKVHNIAGLGNATGERPFRILPRPMLFQPRSTIRIEIEEISEGSLYADGELFIVLHGYKVLS